MHALPEATMLRTLLAALILFCLPLLFGSASDSTVADAERWWSHIQFLADDKLEGRNTGSEGHRRAAEYVATEFERNGLKAAGTAGYFQSIKLRSRRIVESQSSLALIRNGATEPLKLGDDATFSMRSALATKIQADAVFAGYGLSIPEQNHDDLAGLDLRGKIAVHLSGSPSRIPGPLRAHYQSAAERWKALQRSGAIGIASIQNPRTMDIPWERSSPARRQPSMSLEDERLDETSGQKFSVTINPARAGKLFAGTGHTIEEMLSLADEGIPLPRFPLGFSFHAEVQFEESRLESQNVAALLPGSDPQLKNEYVILSAHLDHLGIGAPIEGDSIYNGAMDNASGVATLLEISRYLHESKRSLRRSLLFLIVTGEEKGMLGSRYFANYPTVEAKSIVSNLNLDMFLPLFPYKIVMAQGLEESDLGDHLRAVARNAGVQVQADPEPDRNRFIRSDQYSFIRRGVPALAFKFGYEKGSQEETIHKEWTKKRYHAPSDDLTQPVDREGAARFNRLLLALVERVANLPERPRWKPESFFRRFAN